MEAIASSCVSVQEMFSTGKAAILVLRFSFAMNESASSSSRTVVLNTLPVHQATRTDEILATFNKSRLLVNN